MIGVLVDFAGVVAWRAARLMTVGILRDVEAIRDALIAVGEGEREIAIETGSRDELAQLAGEVRAMVQRLAAEERARRDLVAGVSHDLRTPLTSLQLLSEAVRDEVVDAETRQRYLDTMPTHVAALSTLIDDLFELSRLEAGDVSWSVERFALDELVGETVAAMTVEAQARGVRVEAELPPEPTPARANPEKLQRVLLNLIGNAIRHTPADGSVTVRAQRRDGWIEVEVADSGSGIEDAERERIFDAFYRGGVNAARSGDGAGLGLAISRAIVEAHGGRIWIASTQDQLGARVRFTVPHGA
jgi:signal transduction histidine kinase